MSVTERTFGRHTAISGAPDFFRALLVGVVSAMVCVPAAGEPRVIVISPHTEAVRLEFGGAFARWHGRRFGEEAKVEWRDVGGTSDSVRFVRSEFSNKPEGIGIDVFFGGGSEPFILLEDEGLATRHLPPTEVLSGIPQTINGIALYDPEHKWFGAALSSFGILQNLRVQRLAGLPLVSRWEELARPELLGWVGVGDPRNSGTMNNMFEGYLQAYGWKRGWQLLTGIAGNARKFDRVSATTAKDLTLGETAYAFAVDFYGFAQIAVAGRSNLSFVLPADFTAISPDGIAILRGAPNLEVARRFLDFILGEEGQKLWFLPKGHPEGPRRYSIERMPVRPDLYGRYRDVSNIEFSPFELKQGFRYDAKLARDRREIVAALAGALLVDTQTELKAAWRKVIQLGARDEDREELARVPLTETEALDLAKSRWSSPVVRNQLKIDWQIWAREKYRQLAARMESGGRAALVR